jgi:hypothetical protein
MSFCTCSSCEKLDITEISPSFSIALTTVGVIKNKTNKKSNILASFFIATKIELI